MAYIGQNAEGNFTTTNAKDTFNGDGSTTTFTLSQRGTENNVDVFVNNVRQEPGVAYNIEGNGTSLVFTAAPSTGTNNIYVVNRGPAELSASHPATQNLEAVDGTFTGNLTVDTNTLVVDSTNNRVGVGTDSPDTIAEIRGANPIVTIRDLETSSASAEATLRLAETGASDSLGSYWDIKSSGGKLEFIDNWNEGGGTGTRVTLDDSGNVGIGTSTPAHKLTVAGAGARIYLDGANEDIDMDATGNGQLSLDGNGYVGAIALNDVGMQIYHNSSTRALIFGTNETERMRINEVGRVMIGTTTDGGELLQVRADRAGNFYAVSIHHDGNDNGSRGLEILCGTDDDSGTNRHIDFRDGNGTSIGAITSSGGTVTYGPFTAMHPCILPDADNETGYPYGTLLETTSLSYTQKNGADTERGLIYNVRKTQSANSKAVLGAYGSSENDGEEFINKHSVLVLGDGHILCNNSGGNISIGDGICSSAVAGIGQKATVNPSMIIGIAQEAVTFADDTETKLVAVQYGLQQFIPWS